MSCGKPWHGGEDHLVKGVGYSIGIPHPLLVQKRPLIPNLMLARKPRRLVAKVGNGGSKAELVRTIVGEWLMAKAYFPVPYALDEESSIEGNA